jgi:hypothetical protein
VHVLQRQHDRPARAERVEQVKDRLEQMRLGGGVVQRREREAGVAPGQAGSRRASASRAPGPRASKTASPSRTSGRRALTSGA